MRFVVVTTEARPFDGVFWKAYRDAGGPRPEGVLLLPTANEGISLKALLEGPLMLGVTGFVRLAAASTLGLTVGGDRKRGLHLRVGDVFPVEPERVENINSPAAVEHLEALSPDVLVSVGASQIFSPDVLRVPSRRCLNVHNGCLPSFRGQFATFWEKYTGHSEGCITIHEMTEDVDEGGVVAERTTDIAGPLFSAIHRKKEVGGRLLARLLTEGAKAEARAQPSDRPSDYWSWPDLSESFRFRLKRITGSIP